MSDTPITDAACFSSDIGGMVVKVEFAHTLEQEASALRAGITEAYKIIDVLYMDALDNHKESWPRAREWMEQWKEAVK